MVARPVSRRRRHRPEPPRDRRRRRPPDRPTTRRTAAPRSRSRSSSTEEEGDPGDRRFPLEASTVLDSARRRGIGIEYSSLGPAFKVTATADGANSSPSGVVVTVGYITGFYVPPLPLGANRGGYVHFDEMVVDAKALRKVSTRASGAFGTGLLMGVFALCSLRDRHGCTGTCELLAINDNSYQYAKLVKYYERMGFGKVREVGAGTKSPWYVDLGDQVAWGGAGMLMRAEVAGVIARWERSFRTPK